MEVEKKFVNTFCIVAVLCSFALTGFKLISGVTPQYYLTVITLTVAITTYLINRKYSKLAFFLIKIPGLLVIYLFDDGVSSNAGYFLYYFPYILLSFLYGKSNKNILYYIDIFIIVTIFCLVNFTDIPPKLGLQIPKPQNHNLYLLNLCISIFLSLYLLNLFLNNVIKTKREGTSNEAKLLTLIGSSNNMIWSIDLEYKLTSANDTVISTYERHYKRKVDIGQSVLEGIPLADYKYWRTCYDRTFAGETFKSEQQYSTESVGIRILEYTFTPIRENGIITGLFVTSNDVTASKQYEKEILEREKNLSLIVHSFDDILFEIDSNHNIINVWSNDNSKLKYPLEEIIGKNIKEFNSSGLGDVFDDLIGKVFISGETLKREFEITINEKRMWFMANISLINDEEPRVSIKLEETTLRKNNELETIRQKEFLNQLINNLPVGIFAKDVLDDLKYTIWNNELEKMFGLKTEDVVGKTDFDIFKINEELDDFVDTDSIVIESKEPLIINNLNVKTPGGVIIAKTIKIPIFNENGKAVQVIGILENITEIKRVQDDLINAEKRWNYALTGSRDGVWDLDLRSRVIYYSPVFKKMLGYEENEFDNSTIEWENHVHPKDIQNTLKEFKNHIDGKSEFYQTEYRIRCKDGNYTWVLDRGKIAEYENGLPIRFIGTITDINHLKELEEKSKNNEELLRSINQNITEAIYRSTTNEGLIYINKSFIDMFGFSSYEEAIKTPIYDLYESHRDRDMVINELLQFKTIHNKEVLLRKKSGETFWGLISTICIENENGNFYFDGAIRDISSIKQIEEQLIHAKELAEAAAKAKGLFLSTMSHEIRTPMNAVIGIANLLLNENPSKEQLESLHTLKFSAESLMYLINDILDFSKIDAGKIELENTEFNLTQLLVNIRQSFLSKAEEKGLKFHLQIDSEIPQVLIGDPIRVAQIITNLVSNAIKFTDAGEIYLEALIKDKSNENSQIYFSIRDTGIGIHPDKIPYIFEHFIQASSDTTRKYGGTGLGLAITQKLIELFDSHISVESKLGAGTKFFFELKFSNSDQLNLVIEPKKQLKIEPLTGMKILLVEDNDINTFVVVRFLKKWNISYDVAQNGAIAVDFHNKNKYDLILMDLQMPVMDGYEATIAIRQKDKKTPIIALTANAFSDIKQKVLEVGMNDYVTKPFDPEELYKKIKAAKNTNEIEPLKLF